VYEEKTREISLLSKTGAPLRRAQTAMCSVQKNLASVENEARKKET